MPKRSSNRRVRNPAIRGICPSVQLHGASTGAMFPRARHRIQRHREPSKTDSRATNSVASGVRGIAKVSDEIGHIRE